MTTATAWWILPYLDAETLGQRQWRKCLLSSAWGVGMTNNLSLTAEIGRLTDMVKAMEMRMAKGKNGIESDDMGRGRKEQCSKTEDDEMRLRVGRLITRKTNRETTTENMTWRKVTREKMAVDSDNGTREKRSICDRRKDEGKKGNESRCDEREVNNRDDDRKKIGRTGKKNI